MNKKGFATSTIVFALLSVFLISISILLVTITNTNRTKNALNEKVVSNIEYGNSSINDIEQRLGELENNTLKIDDIYPIGSVYISTTDDTIEKVQNRFGGTWEKYSEGRTIIGDGIGTDNNGVVQTFKNSNTGGEYNHTLVKNEIPSINISGTTDSTGSGYTISYTTTTSTTGAGNAASYRLVHNSGEGHQGNHAVGYSADKGYTDYTDNQYPFQAHTHNYSYKYASSISGIQAHTHKFKGSYTNSSQTSFSVQNPYIVTYIYKRVK